MAFTKVLGPGIHTLSNITSHNIHSSGIVTAVSFVGDGSSLTGIANTDFIVGTAITMGTGNFTGNLTVGGVLTYCLLYTSPSPRDKRQSRMPSSA